MNKNILRLINNVDYDNKLLESDNQTIKLVLNWYGDNKYDFSKESIIEKINLLKKCYSLRSIDLHPKEYREEKLLSIEKDFNITREKLVKLILSSVELIETSKIKSTKFIAIEGIDGSGKTVQLKLLEKYLKNIGTIKSLEFPVYDSFFGKEIGKLLSGKDLVTALTTSPRSMSLWYALDRFNVMKNLDKQKYDYILLNRYTLSSIVYQSIRENSDSKLEEWIFNLEHRELNLPIPDLYIVFNISLTSSKENIKKKGYRDYLGEAADVYESSTTLQEKALLKYKELTKLYKNIEIIDIMDSENNIKNINVIHDEIIKILKIYELC